MIHDKATRLRKNLREIHGKVQKNDETNLLKDRLQKGRSKKARKNEISTGKYEVFKSLEKAGKELR